MVKSGVADENHLKYLREQLGTSNNFGIGLILGQVYGGKYHIVHLAKTPPIKTDETKLNIKQPESPNGIADVNESWVAEHARHTTRMLPGGMCVLGIFLLSENDLLNPFLPKIKSILLYMHKQLGSSQYLFGNGDSEKLVINYSVKNEKVTAKTFDVSNTSVQPVDVKFLAKGVKWTVLETKLNIDEVCYLKDEETAEPLKKHVKAALDKIYNNLSSAIFFFDNEFKENDECLENVKKHKISRGGKSQATQEETKSMQVTFYQQCSGNIDPTLEITDSTGKIRIVGQVSSTLYMNPKILVEDATKAVVEDIMRSLVSRFEMHWDSLTEEEFSEEINSVHEPPRRVLITIPESTVTYSDYLFPGEGPEDVKMSLDEILDVNVTGKLKVDDVEGQGDISQYYNSTIESESEETLLPKLPTDTHKFMYSIGFAVALIVLLISLLIHFLL